MENRVKTFPLLEAPITYTVMGSIVLHFFLVLLYGTLLTPKKSDPPPVPEKFKIEMVKRKPLPAKAIEVKEKKITKAREVVAEKLKEPQVFSPAKKVIAKAIAVAPVPSRIPEKPKASPPVTKISATPHRQVQADISVPALSSAPRSIQRQEARQNPIIKTRTSRMVKAKPADVSSPLPRPVKNIRTFPSLPGNKESVRKSAAGFAQSLPRPKSVAAPTVPRTNTIKKIKDIRGSSQSLARDLPQVQRAVPVNTSIAGRVSAASYKKGRPLDFNPQSLRGMNPVTPNLKSRAFSGQAKAIFTAEVTLAANLPRPRQVPVVEVDPEILKGYLGALQRAIASAKQYPETARKSGQEGKATVQFTVMKNGDVKNIELVSKTGYPILDEEAVQAVKRAAPFSGLPDEIGKPFLEIVLPFKFKLND